MFAGCASTGTNFDDSKVSQIKKGETTEADLIALFGQPNQRTTNSEGIATLTWIYASAKVKGESFIPYAGAFLGGSDTAQKTLAVTLDKNGKVENFNSSVGALEHRSNRL